MKFLIQRKHQPLNIITNGRDYHVAFDKAVVARSVMHAIPPYPQLELMRGEPINICKDEVALNMEVDATLFIKKCKHNTMHPMHDGGYHLQTVKDVDYFDRILQDDTCAMIIPYRLMCEDEEEFVFRCQIIEVPASTA